VPKTAHIVEQLAANRLIRPLSHYTGPAERRVMPLAQPMCRARSRMQVATSRGKSNRTFQGFSAWLIAVNREPRLPDHIAPFHNVFHS
jgi:hypothetical protein